MAFFADDSGCEPASSVVKIAVEFWNDPQDSSQLGLIRGLIFVCHECAAQYSLDADRVVPVEMFWNEKAMPYLGPGCYECARRAGFVLPGQ